MNHIPKFLIPNKNKHRMSSNRTPKQLQRRLALKKNIEYDPPPPPSDPATCQSLRTRSLDLPTSFRIQGIDEGEFDLICQTLGLSGPDDFAIPAAAWEARKARSVSDLLPRLRHLEDEERERETGNDPVLDLSIRFKDSVRVSDEAISTDCYPIVDPFDRYSTSGASVLFPIIDDVASDQDDSVENTSSNIPIIENTSSNSDISSDPTNRLSSSIENMSSNVPLSIIENMSSNWDISSDPTSRCRSSVENMSSSAPLSIIENTSSNWDISSDPTSKAVIKGAMSPIIETTSSNWDIISEDSNGGGNVNKYGFVGGSIGGIKGVRPPLLAPPPSIAVRVIDDTSSTWDIMRSFAPDSEKTRSFARGMSSYSDDEEDREVRPRGSAAFLSESCSFTTTSNDDDSSSTTTEPMSNISPNGRFKRVITYWEKGELLGRGSFGSVYEGIADGGYFIAVKEVSLLDQGDMGRQSIYQLEQEIALLSQFEHENIVQYYGTDKDEAHLYIFLELVTKGSLLSLYQKYHLRDSQVSSYTRQILHGLKYLHERNVVHRDIKCANILVGADGSVKLADFGLAKATKLNDVKSCKGTAFWMAPEVVRGRHQGYGLPADIWSLGCTVLEMLTHRIPYSPLECMQALFRIGRGEPPPIPDSLSKDARDFISRCLKVDPNDRPTASQLLDHSFVRRQLSASPGSSSPYHSTGRGLNFS